MSGLRRLSIDIGGVVSHHLLAYAFPLPASSLSPSLLSVGHRVQSKPELGSNQALFYVLAIWFRWRRAGDNQDRRDRTGAHRSGGAEGREVCLMG